MCQRSKVRITAYPYKLDTNDCFEPGCHECSLRRIDCDRARPKCLKCHDKGMHCSGYGLRFKIINNASICPQQYQGQLSLKDARPIETDDGPEAADSLECSGGGTNEDASGLSYVSPGIVNSSKQHLLLYCKFITHSHASCVDQRHQSLRILHQF